MATEVETRTVTNRLKHADGSIEEITVTERRPKKRHDSMMRHMENLAAGKKRRAEKAKEGSAAEVAAADVADVVDVPTADVDAQTDF